MAEIVYRTKKDLYPKFGCAAVDRQTAYVREDLPAWVKDFVALHELYHLKDRSRWWIWREIKANAHGAFRHPVGFIICVLMSLQPYRLRFYWKKLIGMEE